MDKFPAIACFSFFGLIAKQAGAQSSTPVYLNAALPVEKRVDDTIARLSLSQKVLVLLNGSAVAVNREAENIPAIIESWYGGQEGGTAIADVLTGGYNPGGRLPVTFYTSEKELPAFTGYNMQGRTYRYYTGKPLYEFGYGLSYTSFAYSNLKVAPVVKVGEAVRVTVDVQNKGITDGEEVAQLYLKRTQATDHSPLQCLKGFARIGLKKGEKKTLSFTLKPTDFSYINAENKRVARAAEFQVAAGGKQPAVYKAGTVLTKKIQLTGSEKSFER